MVADAGYGVPGEFRDGLAERGLHYVVGVTEEMVVFQAEPRWAAPPAGEQGRKGRPATRSKLAGDSPRPMSLQELAAKLPRCKVTWREGTKGRLWARFAWVRVWPAGGWADRRAPGCQADLAADRGAGRRDDPLCPVEPAGSHEPDQGGPALEDSLASGTGLSADEGGTRAGPPRGAVVAWVPPPRLPGDAGLRLPGVGTRSRGTQPGPSGKKGGRRPVITLPAIRRALQRLLAPLCLHDCPYCKGPFHALRTLLTE